MVPAGRLANRLQSQSRKSVRHAVARGSSCLLKYPKAKRSRHPVLAAIIPHRFLLEKEWNIIISMHLSHPRPTEPHGSTTPLIIIQASVSACIFRAISFCLFLFISRARIPERKCLTAEETLMAIPPVRLTPPASRRLHRKEHQSIPDMERKLSDDGLMRHLSQMAYIELSFPRDSRHHNLQHHPSPPPPAPPPPSPPHTLQSLPVIIIHEPFIAPVTFPPYRSSLSIDLNSRQSDSDICRHLLGRLNSYQSSRAIYRSKHNAGPHGAMHERLRVSRFTVAPGSSSYREVCRGLRISI